MPFQSKAWCEGLFRLPLVLLGSFATCIPASIVYGVPHGTYIVTIITRLMLRDGSQFSCQVHQTSQQLPLIVPSGFPEVLNGIKSSGLLSYLRAGLRSHHSLCILAPSITLDLHFNPSKVILFSIALLFFVLAIYVAAFPMTSPPEPELQPLVNV